MIVCAARQMPPAEPFLSQPLHNGNFGEAGKICAGVNTPALQGLDELERNSESFERKASDSKSFLSGKALSHKANITASKSYSPHHDLRFDTKTFMELRNAQSVTMAYDGMNPMPPMFCYLKPYYNNVNKSYFRQLADGEL